MRAICRRLHGCVDGINVKLVKCGGIRGALEMIHTARALGFKIMLGCMVESRSSRRPRRSSVRWSIGPTSTVRSSPRGDPFSGITYDDGKIVLPDGPGLGVRELAAIAR